MIHRRLDDLLAARLRDTPAVVLLGPRQVGKTTLAQKVAREYGAAARYLDLERPADLRRLEDPDAYLRAQQGQLVIIDEIHRAPGLFPLLRGIIDERRREQDRTGHFLLLGSASLDLQRQAGESLAGRVAYLELTPVLAHELPTKNRPKRPVDQLWTRGGFPESLLAPTDVASATWRQNFLRSVLERDVPMFAPRMPVETVGRLWRMLASSQGSLLNQARLAASLDISSPTVGRYIDLLSDLLLVRRLQPFSGNLGKRLVRAPKVYVRDSGLVHALLGLDTLDDLLAHPITGASWEGFVIENLIAAAGPRRIPLFFRTEKGAEVDLLFERGGRVEMVIEIKRSTAPTVSRGFRVACEDLSPGAAYVVHSGSESWPMPGGVRAISLLELLQHLGNTA